MVRSATFCLYSKESKSSVNPGLLMIQIPRCCIESRRSKVCFAAPPHTFEQYSRWDLIWLLQICKTCCDLRHQFKNPNFFAVLLAISLKCSFHIRFESLSTPKILCLSMFSNSSLTTMTLLFVVLNLDMKLTCVSCFEFGKDFFPNLIILTNI